MLLAFFLLFKAPRAVLCRDLGGILGVVGVHSEPFVSVLETPFTVNILVCQTPPYNRIIQL